MNKELTKWLSISLLLIPLGTSAQLVNEGATIVVTSNATLYVDSSVLNNSGTITLEEDATLRIGDDLINDVSAVITAHDNSLVKCTGDQTSHLDLAGDDLGKLELAKDAGVNVELTDDLTLTKELIFSVDDNRLILDDKNVTLDNDATVSGYSALRYVEADALGEMIKNWDAIGTFTYPVGDNDEYSPADIEVTAATFGMDASLGIKIKDEDHPNLPISADDYISRYWLINETDVTGLVATVTGTYLDADINGSEANIKGAGYVSSDWNYEGSAADNPTNSVTAELTADMDLTGLNFYGRFASLRAFLKGPYSGGEMTTKLNDDAYIPLSTPYGTGESVASIPVDVTDWMKIEIRDASDSTIILNSYSCFINKDGDLLDTAGNVVIWMKDAPTSGFISLAHRNHLGIMTPSALELTSPATYDYSTGMAQAWMDDEDPMSNLGGGVFGMWSGNAKGNTRVKYNGSGNDKVRVLVKVGTATPSNIVNGYHIEDVNMDGKVKYNGSKNDKVKILTNVGTATPSNIIHEQLPN